MDNPFLATPIAPDIGPKAASPARSIQDRPSNVERRRKSSAHGASSVISGSTAGKSNVSQQTAIHVGPTLSDQMQASAIPGLIDNLPLTERVRNMIPDIQSLVYQHEEMCATLAMRESHINRLEQQKSDDDKRLERLGEELKAILDTNQAEKSDLRRKIQDLQDTQDNLQNRLAKEMGQRNAMKTSLDELTVESKEKAEASSREREEMLRSHIDEKTNLQSAHEEDRRAMAEQFRIQTGLAEARWSERIVEATQLLQDEKQHLETRAMQERRDLEASHTRACQEFEAGLDSLMKALNEERLDNKKAKRAWENERADLFAQLNKQKELSRKQVEADQHSLAAKYEPERDEAIRSTEEAHGSSHARRHSEFEKALFTESRQRAEAQSNLARIQRDAEQAKKAYDDRLQRLEQEIADLRFFRAATENAEAATAGEVESVNAKSSLRNTTLQDLDLSEVGRLRSQIAAEESRYKEAHDTITKLQRELDLLRGHIQHEDKVVPMKELEETRHVYKIANQESSLPQREPEPDSTSRAQKRMTLL